MVAGQRRRTRVRNTSNQQRLNEQSTQTQQSKLLNESARLKGLLGQGSNLKIIFCLIFVDYRKKTLDKLTDQPGKLIPLDRGGVSDLSVSGDKSDLVVVDPHDPTTTRKLEVPMQSLNQLPMVTNLAGAKSA